MLEFIIVMVIIDILCKWNVGYKTIEPREDQPEPKAYEFDSLDDAMEYAELRRTGWKGDAKKFYEWKYDE